MGHPSSGKKNRRSYPRLSCTVPVEVLDQSSKAPFFATVADISMGGCFVQTQALVVVATQCSIKFTTDLGELQVNGVVARNNPGTGIAIRFDDTSLQDRERITLLLRFVESLANHARSGQRYLSSLARTSP